MTKSIIFVSSDSKQDLNYGIVNWSRRGREERERKKGEEGDREVVIKRGEERGRRGGRHRLAGTDSNE